MKTGRLPFITLLLTVGILSYNFAQDNTKVGLPEGAIARLGKGGINLMRFSPDGTRLAVGTDVAVWVYDVPDGKETALFTGHTGQVNALAFSTDGNILASGGFNNPIIQLWDLETGNKPSTLTLPEKYTAIAALAFAKDNTILISLDQSRELAHWDVDTGKKLADPIRVDLFKAAAFSPDSGAFATGDKDGIIRLWDATTNRRWATFSEPFNEAERPDIRALAFSPDGKILASSSDDQTVRLWDTEQRSRIATLRGHGEAWITTVAFSTNGKMLATGDANKIIKLWDVSTGRERATLRGHKSTINALTFIPDKAALYGGYLASGSADGTIRFWNPDTEEELVTFTTGHTEWVNALAFAEDGTTLTSAAFNGNVKVWSLTTMREVNTHTIGQGSATEAVTFSPDVKHVVSQSRDSLMVAFNPYNFEHIRRFQGRSWIQLWELATNEEIHGPWRDMDVNTSQEMAALSPHGILAVSGSKEIRAWYINTGLELFRLNTEKWIPSGRMVFSSDGTKLALISPFSTPKVWDVTTQQEITAPNINHVNVLAFSPDNATLALGGREGIYLWKSDTPTTDEPKVIPSNLHLFREVLTFSPDGSILVDSGMEDRDILIKLWDVETGNQLITLTGHTETITTLVFSHDRKTLASGSEDGTVLLWDWDKIIDQAAQDNR